MKSGYELAFSTEYLMGLHCQLDEDSRIIESILIAVENVTLSTSEKQKIDESFKRRMRVCGGCPIYILAVWDEETI